MKAIPFKIPKEKDRSIKVQVDDGPHFYDKLHYHPEIQISTINKGKGILYGGTNTVQFQEGDTLIMGGNFPHLLKNSSIYYADDSPGVLSHSLFFDHASFGGGFLQMRELHKVNRLLTEARRGILIRSVELTEKITDAANHKDHLLVLSLMDILVTILNADKYYINDQYSTLPLDEGVGHRLNSILNYTFSNISSRITIKAIANVANLSESQFSRYFKTHTGKSYIQFLNDIRIETACNLLQEEHRTIASICYEVGFKNVSNFNRKFKQIKSLTPREYKAEYQSK